MESDINQYVQVCPIHPNFLSRCSTNRVWLSWIDQRLHREMISSYTTAKVLQVCLQHHRASQFF